MILYHGTSTAHWKRIKRWGLQPRQRTASGGNWPDCPSADKFVYLTTAYPVYFAVHAADSNPPGQPLVLKVDVDEEDLFPDEDWLARVVKQQGRPEFRGLDLIEITQRMDPEINQHLALQCLESNGVACVRRVEPRRIVDHVVVPFERMDVIMLCGGDAVPIPIAYKVCGQRYREIVDRLFESLDAAVDYARSESLILMEKLVQNINRCNEETKTCLATQDGQHK